MRTLATKTKYVIATILCFPLLAAAAFVLRVGRAEHAPLVEIPPEHDDETLVDIDGDES
jgi:hypothetical protein